MATNSSNAELNPQELRFKRRKDIIKNVAIVFLAVMLVLTFFSNTIMNYSLPQVAVTYIESGSITAQIRGSGIVESGDPYNVMVNQSRTVQNILVRVGQDVQKGDVLMNLAEGDSAELEAAKKELENAKDAYNDLLLTDGVTAAILTASKGNISVDAYRTQITSAQNAVDTAQKEVDKCQAVVDDLTNKIAIASDAVTTNTELDKAKANLDKAKADYDAAVATYQKYKPTYDAYVAMCNANDTYLYLESVWLDLKDDLTAAETEVTNKEADYNTVNGDASATDAQKAAAAYALNNAYAARDALVAQVSSAETDKNEAYKTMQDAEKEFLAFGVAAAGVQSTYNTYESQVSTTLTIKDNAEAAYEAALAAGGSGSSNDTYIAGLRAELATANVNLSNANKVLLEKMDALSDLVGDIGTIRTLNELYNSITEAQKNVDKLTKDTAGLEVKAPISGSIISINVSSGKLTSPDVAVVVIQPEDMGYTMSFTVSNDEAKQISVGAPATVTNSWWYDDVTGKVLSVKPDPSAPNTSKKVTLEVFGSLTDGQTLSMSIESRTTNYDMIVPNSAIHEDNNGKFILVVQSKPSPLGNRYFAVRYDVEVMAKDDNKSAIKCAVNSYEYVITTSSKPISAGDQVRLSES